MSSQYALAKAIGVLQIRISEIVNGKRASHLTQLSGWPATSAQAPRKRLEPLRPMTEGEAMAAALLDTE